MVVIVGRRRICITVSDSIIALLEQNNIQKSAFFESAALYYFAVLQSVNKTIWSPGRDLNPRPADYKSAAEGFISKSEPLQKAFWVIEQLRDEFAKWEKLPHDKKSRRVYVNTIQNCHSIDCLTAIKERGSKNQRIAVRKIIKMAYERGLINIEEKERLLSIFTIPASNPNEVFYDDADVQAALEAVRNNKKHYYFTRLVIESGLRRKHATLAMEKIARDEYKVLGDIALVDLNHTTETKNAFLCLCGADTAREIEKNKITISEKTVDRITARRGIKFNAIRKWWTDVALDARIDLDIVDFIQGRAAASVRAKYYIQKRKRAIKQYPRVLRLIRERIEL